MMGIDRSIELDDSTFRSVCVMDLNAFGASGASQNRHSSCAGVMAEYHQRRPQHKFWHFLVSHEND